MTTQTKLDRKYIEQLSEQKGEPAWMKERRLAAWDHQEKVGVPHYERTRLRESNFDRFVPTTSGTEVGAWDELPAEVKDTLGDPADRAIIVQHNARTAFRQIPADLPEGVIVTDLETAVREHPELVEKYFMNRDFPDGDNKIVALNAALNSGGLFVYVPEGVRVEKPLEFVLWIDEADAGIFDHAIVVAEPRSRVTVLETALSDASIGRAYRYGVLDLFAGRGARVTCGNVQALGDEVQSLVVRRTEPEERSRVDWVAAEFGSSMSVNEMDSRVNSRGTEVRGLGVFFAADRQHLDLEMLMIHEGRESGSDILVRGVTRDRARAVYGPYTLLKHNAKDSTGFQRGNTLVLDRTARAYSIPQLHVEEDEVQGAGHAATIGNVDEDHMFYLRSRGLSELEAKRLIVDGFFYPVLEYIPVESVREQVLALIDRKMAT